MICSSTDSGEAPGQESETVMVGLSTSGYWLTPMRVSATTPNSTVAAISIQAKTGFLIETSVMFTAPAPSAGGFFAAVPGGAGPCGTGAARWPTAARGACAAGAERRFGCRRIERIDLARVHARSVRERLDAAHDQELARREAAFDLDPAVFRVHPERHDLLLRGAALDDVNDVAVVRGAGRGARDHGRGALGADVDGDFTERAGTQPILLVLGVDLGGDGHGVRGRIGCGGDERDLGLVVAFRFAERERHGHTGLEARRVVGLDLEAQEQRIGPQQRRHQITGVHVLAGLDGSRLDRAIHRRAHERVPQIDLRRPQRLFCHGGVGLGRHDFRLVGGELFARNEPGVLGRSRPCRRATIASLSFCVAWTFRARLWRR